jgi:hypothetical protein
MAIRSNAQPSKSASPAKAAAAKPTAPAPKAPAPKATKATQVSAEERWRMIAEAAYFRAEKRGFSGGDPADDWVQAEKQIDALLKK